MNDDPHFSMSQINMLLRCGMQYYYRYACGLRRPPGVAMLIGSGTHTSVETNLRNVISTGEPIPQEAAEEVARDAVNNSWEAQGVVLDEDEAAEGEKKVKGKAVASAVRMSVLHHGEVAPQIKPIAVEKPFRLHLPDGVRDLIGFVDIEEPDGLIDTKTKRGKAPQKGTAETSLQLTAYSMASWVESGKQKNPDYVAVDFLVDKPNGAEHLRQSTQFDQEDYGRLLRRIAIAEKQVEAGLFMPCDPGNWCCSAKFCGYWDECPFGRKQSVTVNIGECEWKQE